MGWILLLLSIAAFVLLYFYLRQRRQAHQDAEAAREQAFLMAIQGLHGSAPGAVGSTPSVADASPSKTRVPTDTAASGPTSEPTPSRALSTMGLPGGRTYLEPAHQLVLQWLQTSLPECRVFVRSSLRRVLGREWVVQDRSLDFVICDGRFEVIAAVDLMRGGRRRSHSDDKRQLLESAGVRYACWDTARLPEQSELVSWLALRDGNAA